MRRAKFSRYLPTRLCVATIVAVLLLAPIIVSTCRAQQQKPTTDETNQLHEMLATPNGFLAIDSPKNWIREEAPTLAFFVPPGTTQETAPVWIYISSAPIGSEGNPKNIQEYIASDIAGFRKQFKAGIVHPEAPINLPAAKRQALVYNFQSGEAPNAFEEIVYVGEANRVLILVLSAKTKDAFNKARSDFRSFVESYRGSITTTDPSSK